MSKSPDTAQNADLNARCFGLRIENNVLQVAIATRLHDGRFRIDIDGVECPSPTGWFTSGARDQLADAMATLVERHDMRRSPVAVSLDGAFCVTRVIMGPADKVDAELAMQGDRVPRYLQLGPGEKVTGAVRTTIASHVDYAVTGVVNRSLIQLIYEVLREADIDVQWVEPSLISIARLVGQAEIGGDEAIMIADGTGKRWDVGIACAGRLLLDYRPAAAKTDEGFRAALDGHITRLKRFCLRHRGMAGGELRRLMICGTGEKPQQAVDALGDSLGIQPEILSVPDLPGLYELDSKNHQADSVPAVATVLPLLINESADNVLDLLDEVRRAPELPLSQRLVRLGWPVIAASVILAITYTMVSTQRRKMRGNVQQRAMMESQIRATQVRMSDVSHQRDLVRHLEQIETQTAEPNWDRLLTSIAQSLPVTCRLNEYRVESDGRVLLDGVSMDEVAVYDLVQTLRAIPSVDEVALKGTSAHVEGTQFEIELVVIEPTHPSAMGTQHE